MKRIFPDPGSTQTLNLHLTYVRGRHENSMGRHENLRGGVKT